MISLFQTINVTFQACVSNNLYFILKINEVDILSWWSKLSLTLNFFPNLVSSNFFSSDNVRFANIMPKTINQLVLTQLLDSGIAINCVNLSQQFLGLLITDFWYRVSFINMLFLIIPKNIRGFVILCKFYSYINNNNRLLLSLFEFIYQ